MVLLELFWSFCKIGFTSFGGLSMVPLINHEMLSHGWMTAEQVTDIVAIAEMTPGPISNPGLSSLRAALNPEFHNYYYYVLNPETGMHTFSTTYEEHSANVAAYAEGQ